MKISWTSLKISIAGAKLSHLVQKDKIWDHGSMAEQARIIFCLVQKAKCNGNLDSLKKYLTVSCFENLKKNINQGVDDEPAVENPVIKELAVMEAHPGKDNKPDMFTALIKGISRDEMIDNDQTNEFSAQWSFVRQGEWWLLDDMKIKKIIFKN
jgi:predicted lipid-binding transport protein (Tim44 family)